MKIVHFAPFAPNASGMYEAARDMVVADYKAGHKVFMVDVGATTEDGKKIAAKPGQKDSRGDVEIITATPNIALDADILFFHTGVPDNWVVKTQSPIVFVMHGRPTACFNTEIGGKNASYTLMQEIGTWPRVKTMLTFWPSHVPFWAPIIDKKKIVCLEAPPIDETRFSPTGQKYDFAGKGGDVNIVIADTSRSDVNIFEVLNGVIYAAERVKGLRVHLFALPSPLPKCWELLTSRLKQIDALGAMWGRRTDMDEVYRAADIVISPQRIATRSVAEPLSCGVSVIAADGCEFANATIDPWNPREMLSAINEMVFELKENRAATKARTLKTAEVFRLERYSKVIGPVYEEIRRV